jgi:hypothetical protein
VLTNYALAEPAIVNVLRDSLVGMQSNWRLTGYPVIVIGTTSESGRVPPSLLSCFKQEIVFEVHSTVYVFVAIALNNFTLRLLTKANAMRL